MKKKYIAPNAETIIIMSKEDIVTMSDIIDAEFGMGDKEEGWL